MISLGQVHVSLELRDLFKSGLPLRIGTRAFDILELLVNCPGRLVSKDEILQRVWPDTVVEENNLQVHISALRKALGADRDLIRTIPGRGYMLMLAEEGAEAEEAEQLPLACQARLPYATPLVGRESLLDEICQALQDTTLLTLVGAGGIGKTTLAVAVAHRYCRDDAQAVSFVCLAQLTCPERVLDALACSLGVGCTAPSSLLEATIDELNRKPRLVVLDNCEHVIEAVAALGECLIQACPASTFLATSRESLRINGERSMVVPPLALAPEGADRQTVLRSTSAQLFLKRLRALDWFFPQNDGAALDDQSVALVGEVCRRLDGIPLALEMAAARASTLGLFELASNLQEHLHLLGAGLRTAPDRHQSLEASLQWSYRLLSSDEKAVLRRIAELQGRFTLYQACEVAILPGISRTQVMDCIVGLALKSLLVVTAEGPFKFYRLLDVTRLCILQRTGKVPLLRSPEASAPRALGVSLSDLRAKGSVEATLPDIYHLHHQRILATSQ
ncbi:putative ATPase/DNA-binding winged helix-turn-helix (wHTH) protein [Pseudomonas sp. JUb42]|jgi:predicted ATPase/DNA-binding winged helix-turn-helix (wHTH) protein|uniref:ATP-binding protein n=1 Tax=Pseudomonas sp. JUb42 TaxID=2940611 RepID=UPI0021684FBE|nr:helix-turn-helix transcriptional regulator [Pseudomonas sp. JUb42]MCS3471846.1 putative ATPase/DNA-binding winged helix-turn-helix (wHTH) protein [Pseudomonas sp. JUb42]